LWANGEAIGATRVKRKIRVAVIFGGKSGEHEVSLASARSIMAAMDKDKYEIFPVGITKSGRWLTTGDPMALLSAGVDAPPEAEDEAEQALPNLEGGGDPDLLPRRELVPGLRQARFPAVDVVFPVLHGPYGEDGTIQGLLEIADLPYVGAGVLGSALGMDKAAMKSVFKAHGLPVVEHMLVLRKAWAAHPERVLEEIEARFTYPLFLKPANLGSSVGVSKAHHREELVRGLNLAARFDRKILVEAAVNAREVECSVLGNDEPIASIPGEVVPCNEFYDYKAKYIDNASKLYIPADLPAETTKLVQELAVRAFVALDCAGMARVDFFLCRDTGKLYVNELNTIPGFTSISMYPKLWEASGIPYPELIDRLIELAIERYNDKHASETSYGFDH
jgi:D-alanine-D-alanine ligase